MAEIFKRSEKGKIFGEPGKGKGEEPTSEEKKEPRELNSDEEFIVENYTGARVLLERLKENPKLLMQETMWAKRSALIGRLEKLEIISLGRRGAVERINWEKFQELQPYSIEGRILELLDSDKKRFWTAREIAPKFHRTPSRILQIVEALEEESLINTKFFPKRPKIFFSKEYEGPPITKQKVIERLKEIKEKKKELKEK